MTEPQHRALEILKDTSYSNPMTAQRFSQLMWPGYKMHDKHIPKGAPCCGSWLSAGSYLAKLAKKGWVYRDHSDRKLCIGRIFWISYEGKKLLTKHEV